ncbi:MAG: hypothetical protein ACFFC7_27915 [Candidatus Hermodarchaeota archaeon]
MENEGKINAIKIWFSKTVEEDLSDEIASDDRVASVVIIVVCVLIGLYFVAHQLWSTGFFTATFGFLEMLLLYGTLIYWIVTSSLILLGLKNPSRDLDSFGGLFFATFSIAWLFLVFPFEFAYFADVLPAFIRFLVQWISNDIARVLLVLLFILHLVFAVISLILRVNVYKARARKM